MVTNIDRKARIREYKENPLPAGVYRVRNMRTGKSLIGPTPNLPGMLNRQRFQLQMGSHADAELQSDWNELGPEAFEFEVLDRLEPSDDPASDQSKDLKVLVAMWLEKLSESGVALYRQSLRGA
jgi:hypothetical protein